MKVQREVSSEVLPDKDGTRQWLNLVVRKRCEQTGECLLEQDDQGCDRSVRWVRRWAMRCCCCQTSCRGARSAVLCRKKRSVQMMSVTFAVCSRALNMKEKSIISWDCAMTCWEIEYGDVKQPKMKRQNWRCVTTIHAAFFFLLCADRWRRYDFITQRRGRSGWVAKRRILRRNFSRKRRTSHQKK